jgi:hypothetical protein
MSALEFSTFLTDVAATIAQHVTTDSGDASLAAPGSMQHDVHLAEAEALVRRATTALTAAVTPAVTTAVTTAVRANETAVIAQSPSSLPSSLPSQSPSSLPPQSAAPDPFLLDHEKLVWHFPDTASRLIEELR